MANPLPEWVPLNWELIRSPVNWAIVVLMVAIGAIILCVVGGAIGHANTNSDNS